MTADDLTRLRDAVDGLADALAAWAADRQTRTERADDGQ